MNNSASLYAMYLAAPELFDRSAEIRRDMHGTPIPGSPTGIPSSPSTCTPPNETQEQGASRLSGRRGGHSTVTGDNGKALNDGLRQAVHTLVRSLIGALLKR